jgi:hypothetical protein
MTPTKSILDKSFRYTNSSQTNVAKTFDRIRREQKAQKDALDAKLVRIVRKGAA